MFYSHQLLSKKGPLGQIWIAATMQAKINRRKTEQIDISDICEQILQPQVPLALRLSGILMGGLVVIYARKVSFLYEDASDFLIKIKAVARVQEIDQTTLPRGKRHARMESITIDYVGGNPVEDLERHLLEPSTPEKRRKKQTDEYFRMPARGEGEGDFNDVHSTPGQSHQATLADITLEDQLPDYGGAFPETSNAPSDGNIDLFAEVDLPPMDLSPPEPMPPAGTAGLETIVEEAHIPPPPPPDESKETDNSNPKPPDLDDPAPRRKRKYAKGKNNGRSVLDDSTVISAVEFNDWLQNPIDTVGRKHVILTPYAESLRLDNLLSTPSTGLTLSLNKKLCCWPAPLIKVWQRNFTSEVPLGSNEGQPPHAQQGQTADGRNHGHERPRPGSDVGSIEKMRAGLTPSGSGGMNMSPGLAPMDSGGRSAHSRRSSSVGGIPMEAEGENPNSGSRKKQRISDVLDKGTTHESVPKDVGNEDYQFPDMKGVPTFDQDPVGRRHTGSATPYDLMEETGQATQTALPHESIDTTSANLLHFLREQYETEQAETLSMDELAGGLERWRAAKFFFQVCVLASNRYLGVQQATPYGDIKISRGQYL